MSVVRLGLVALSAALQLFLFVGLAIFVVGVIEAFEVYQSRDPALLAGSLSQTIVLTLMSIVPAFLGLLIGCSLIKSTQELPKGFRGFSRILAYVWLLIFPFGTLVAYLQLKWLTECELERSLFAPT